MTNKALLKQALDKLPLATFPFKHDVIIYKSDVLAAIAQPVQQALTMPHDERRTTLINCLRASKSWTTDYATVFVDDYFSAQPVQPAPTWQPIDTAPQDDTAVDLWDTWGDRHCNMQRVVHSVINIYYAVLPGESGSGCERSVHSGGHITHWMPVPGAPV